MSTAKDHIVEIINRQPDDSSYDDIVRELAFDLMVQRGLKDSDEQRTIANDEMERRIKNLAEINWTHESEIWLKDIYNYIAADDAEAAARTVTNIYAKAQLLRNHPRLGRRYEPEQSREIRVLLYEHYRIAYLIKPSGDIDVLGVFHGALDINRYFI